MKEKLIGLGFNNKEVEVYMYLIEFDISPASEIARYLKYPKSSINFIADNLWKRGVLKKSFRGKTGYYEADIFNLEKIIKIEIENKKDILEDIIPKLKQKSQRHISRPKIIFIDGIGNCKKAYLDILKSNNKYYEIGNHQDLVDSFGEDFMNTFIKSRVKNNLFCYAISNNGDVEKKFENLNEKEKRKLKLFDENIFGKIHSTIAIYDNKVLILNLNGKNNGILIENMDFYETMKTVFSIITNK